MKIVKPLAGNIIMVKYNDGRYQGRIQTGLWFEREYPAALRAALEAIESGCTNVEVIQFREVLHSHRELVQAAYHLNPYSTDEEVVEAVHHASRKQERSQEQTGTGIMHMLRSALSPQPVVWASL